MKTTAMLVSPSKAAGLWKENTEMEISGTTFSLIQVTIHLWRQLRHHPEIQYNTACVLTTFPENLLQFINSQLLTILRGQNHPLNVFWAHHAVVHYLMPLHLWLLKS